MKEKADLLLINGIIYTVDENNPIAGAMAIRDGIILATGNSEDIADRYAADEIIDLAGRCVYPGFIDAHCHFYGYGVGLQYVDLVGLSSFDEVIQQMKQVYRGDSGTWLVGRGWDHNLWPEKKFPNNSLLNSEFPGVPVVLTRIDGHVVLASETALALAGIGVNNTFGAGQVEMVNGRMTGILSETAADWMRNAVPEPDGKVLDELLTRAEENCTACGLTAVFDAGLDAKQLKRIDSLQQAGVLSLFIYAMLTPGQDVTEQYILKGVFQTDRLSVRALKIYADGSLGSRTAWLKQPYSDAPTGTGISVTSNDSIRKLCRLAADNGYQVCSHAIGDRAVHEILSIYGEFLKGKNDLRWRIEHAQVVDPVDFSLFGEYSIIPSVQATHATSDMAWAVDRLGPKRIKGAYAYRELMAQNGWIANGTDFPIEQISPVLTFYAAVARRDLKGMPEGGFQIENALSREDALRSITLWAAKSGFLEKERGSLEPGKLADLVVLDRDIMKVDEKEIPGTVVLKTFIGGKLKYENKKGPEKE